LHPIGKVALKCFERLIKDENCFKSQILLHELMNSRHNIDWHWTSMLDLTENLIRQYQNHVVWSLISKKQFSKEFLQEFKDRIDWDVYNAE